MKWLHEACSDDQTGRVSSARIAVLISSATLCISTLWLTVAAYYRIELVPALTVFGGSLAGLAGSSYVANRMGGKNDKPNG